MAAPSNHSITSTRRLDSSGYVCGIATDGRSTSVSNPLKWSIVRASLRRSSSSHSWLRSPASIGSIIWAWAPATRDATRGMSHPISWKSAATLRSMPGRRIFTATSVPSASCARCTTAIDARPTGSGSNSANVVRSGSWVARSTSCCTLWKPTGRPWSSSDRNATDTSSPNTDGAEATSWPNFT